MQWPVVFISGGGSGLGLYLCQRLLEGGAKVALFDLHLSADLREQLQQQFGEQALGFYEVDVCNAETLATAMAAASEKLGAPSLAVNSAGVQLAKEFLSYSSEEFSWVVNVNLIGSRNFAAAVLPLMATGGRLALVASLAGLLTSYSYAAYNASKHGVVGLAGALRMDCIPLGVEVSVICPPEVETPMVEEERKTMHPIAKQQKEVAGSLSLEQAGEEILSALGRGKYMIIPGFRARWVWRISRWLPNTMATISSAMVRKFSDT